MSVLENPAVRRKCGELVRSRGAVGTEASGKQEVMKRGYSGETPGRDGCLKPFTLCQKVAEPECYLGGTRPWWKSECPACSVLDGCWG